MRAPSGRGRGRSIAPLLSLVLLGLSAWPVTARAAAGPAPVAKLQILTRSPVLVRAGERVRVPVDVVCATTDGTVCPARVSLRVGAASSGWQTRTAPASLGLAFDATSASTQALGAHGTGVASFRIQAASGGATASLPPAGEGPAVRYYVTDDMATVAVPPVAFGDTTTGTTAVYLPWGSGPSKAGLAPGIEGDTLGPSSFDVDASGRILLADPLQGRVTTFSGARLIRTTKLPLGPRTDVAFAQDGSAFVASDGALRASTYDVAPSGAVVAAGAIGVTGDMLSEIRTAGSSAYAYELPLEAWRPVAPADTTAPPTTGMPLADGSQLLEVVNGDAVRLGVVRGESVTNAVELSFAQHVGEIALAEPDGAGGYLAVVHVWRDAPAADQFQVIHVGADLSVKTFAVADADYADTMPLSRFRIGGDGALYQLATSPDGARIVRYELGGIR